MSFISFFSNNKTEIASIIFKADATTPQLLRTVENRFFTDKHVRFMLCTKMPEFFSFLDSCRADLLFIPYKEGVSFKRMDNVFPRNKIRGGGMTVPRPIVIVNALGKCNSIPFETDYLLAYQPTRKNQKFSIGIMRGNKVRKLSYKSGDQWKINHELKDWEWTEHFAIAALTAEIWPRSFLPQRPPRTRRKTAYELVFLQFPL